MIFQNELIQSLKANGSYIAIEDGGNKIGYSSLQSKAEKILGFLMDKSLVRETIIGIDLDARPEIICSVIGVATARCVFVLIDRKLPSSRIDHMLKDMTLDHVITTYDRLDFYKHRNLTNVWNYQEIQSAQPFLFESLVHNAESDDSLYIYYTSGSTGIPKAILGKNSSLLQFLKWEIEAFKIDNSFRFSQLISPYFDAFLRDIFVPLLSGATICIPPVEEDFFSEDKLTSWIDDTKISLIHCVPSLFGVFNSEKLSAANFVDLQYVLLSGEKIIPSDLSNWYNVFDDRIQLVNLYGTTEATMIRSCYRIQPQDVKLSKIPIGHPIADTELLIATKDMKPCNIMVQGELYIISDYLTKGYLNAPEQTKEKFITINAGTAKEKNAYKTGDLAVKLINGNIELIGREDRQVKIRGIRVELDEVESTLKQSDMQKKAVVTMVSNDNGDESIAAFIVKKDQMQPDKIVKKALSDQLKNQLPAYMIPSDILVIDQIPLLSNGKIDYKALKRIQKSDREMVLPVDQIEEQILEIWKNILGGKPISTTDVFHKVGGNSLTLMSLIARINKAFEIRISLSQIFQNSTVQKQAAFIREAKKEAFENIPKADKADDYMLSSTQKRMFFLNEFNENSIVYNMHQVVRLEGELNKERIEYVFKQLIVRHESLRTSFKLLNGVPVQKISDNVDFNIEYFDSLESGISDIISGFVRPFGLENAPLMRVGIIDISPEEHILMADFHHIICDGVSQELLIREFMTLYKGDTLLELKLTYKDFASWQHSETYQKHIARQEEFWLDEFSEKVEVFDLPTDFIRPSIKSFEGDVVSFEVNKEETAQLESIAKREDATMNMVMLSAYYILLAKLSNQNNIVVGTTVAGRHHSGLENMLGMFVNTICLRNSVDGNLDFKTFLSNVKSKTLSCLDNQDYPYEELIDTLQLERNTSRNPLFDVMFSYQNYKQTQLEIPELVLSQFPNSHSTSKFDLTMFVVEEQGKLSLHFEYAKALFTRKTIERFVGYFQRIITALIADNFIIISDIEIISEEERLMLLEDFNSTEAIYPSDMTVIDLFEHQVARTPKNVALIFGGEDWSYSEFARQIDNLASQLIAKDIRQGDIIGILCDRSFEMMVGIYAVMKSGAAYLPIDPNYPEDRINYILQDSESKLLLLTPEFSDKVIMEVETMNLYLLDCDTDTVAKVENRAEPNNLAYVIYTSGSTGRPKGVTIEHHSLMNRLYWMGCSYPIDKNDTIIQKTPYVFDVSVWELFWWSQQGSKLCILPPNGEKDPSLIVDQIIENHVTTIHFVPSMLQAFLNHVEQRGNYDDLSTLKWVFSSGEVITRNQVDKFNHLLNHSKLINLYGPTEATIDVTYFNCDSTPKGVVPIGKPISNTNAYILGKDLCLLPTGVVGELNIGGVGVARGYLNNEDLTKEKFIPNPFSKGDRLYRTGDLAKWLPDGNLEYVGRIDDQVKLRGFRIEIGEIETCLLSHVDINEVKVLIKGTESTQHLVAYYISDTAIDRLKLRDHLAVRLPDYMIPSYFVWQEHFPLTANGKLNIKAFPDPDVTLGEELVLPAGLLEEALADVWAEVLNIKKELISINRNFFELGGDSLKILQLKFLLKDKLELEVSVLELFRYSSISSFVTFVHSSEKSYEKLESEMEVEISGIESMINKMD